MYGIGDGDGNVLGLLVITLDTVLPRSIVSFVANHSSLLPSVDMAEVIEN
jgi:hypothetical protein